MPTRAANALAFLCPWSSKLLLNTMWTSLALEAISLTGCTKASSSNQCRNSGTIVVSRLAELVGVLQQQVR